MKIALNEWPVLVVAFPARGTRGWVNAYLEKLTTIVQYAAEHGGKVAVVVDISELDAHSTTAELRSHFADRIASLNTSYPDTIACSAVVCPSLFLRGLVSAYVWLSASTRGYPMFTHDTLPKARANVTDYLDKLGAPRIPPPPAQPELLQNAVRSVLAAGTDAAVRSEVS